MRELIQINTADWQLAVYGPAVNGKQRVLSKTMAQRAKVMPCGFVAFDRLLNVSSFKTEEGTQELNEDVGALVLPAPVLFENTDYMFELLFTPDQVESAQITHKLATIQNSFRTKQIGKQLLVSGSLNFGNNVGWFSLPFSYRDTSSQQSITVKFLVLPTKMDLDSDLQEIYRRLDRDYPLWRFGFGNSTETTADAQRQSNHNFPLLWLARFTGLREKFEKNIRILLNAPHSKLIPVERRVKAERLKGKLNAVLQEKLVQDLDNQAFHKSYLTSRKILSLDTPENRFIKMVIQQAHFQLGRFINLVTAANNKPDSQVFSDNYLTQLTSWQRTLEKSLHHPMFKEVGSFKGMSKESLVLQQKTGYSGVYQTWHELKRYLDVMGSQSSISMKTIDELYEVWCFLEIRRLLKTELGFSEEQNQLVRIRPNQTTAPNNDVLADSYRFKRDDGLTIRLAHEPIFKKTTTPVRSWLHEHKPDIVLEASFADGHTLLWLFDAKYRIDNSGGDAEKDLAPADAIYQMHRYRDALIHVENAGEYVNKSRSVYGAYALYPGSNDQTKTPETNAYAEAIHSIGIGAFPLLPSAQGDNGCRWLKEFLIQQFGHKYPLPSNEVVSRYLLEDSARIPHYGMQQVFYPDLTLVITAAPETGRDSIYVESFKNGSATCYHTKLFATERLNIQRNMIHEIRYCVIATQEPNNPNRVAHFIWPVKSVRLVKRHTLNALQTGLHLDKTDNRSSELYWFFEFGPSTKLTQPIYGFDYQHHQLKVTTRQKLNGLNDFEMIEQVYNKQ